MIKKKKLTAIWDPRFDLLNKVRINVADEIDLHFILTDRQSDIDCTEFKSCLFLHHFARCLSNMLNKHLLEDYWWLQNETITCDEWIHMTHIAGLASEELKNLRKLN